MSALRHARLPGSDHGSPMSSRWSTGEGLLEISGDYHDLEWLLTLRGELDLSNVALLEQELRLAEASDAETIVVDLSALEFMDSSGLHALMRAERRSRGADGRLRLIPGTRLVQSLFRRTGMEEQLPFVKR